jgi:hypothetical protein
VTVVQRFKSLFPNLDEAALSKLTLEEKRRICSMKEIADFFLSEFSLIGVKANLRSWEIPRVVLLGEKRRREEKRGEEKRREEKRKEEKRTDEM